MLQRTAASRAWPIVLMLFVFMLINFADKAVLGLSAGPIMRDLGLNHTQFGLIGTSFFAFFSLGAVLVGFLVNRVPTKWVLAAMALIWSLCQLPILLATSWSALLASRIVLGLGEGPAYPVALHSAFKWFPNERRPLPTSLIALGGAVGAGIIAPAVVYVIRAWSWHAAFGLLGMLGLVWCVVWLAVAREGPITGAGTPRAEPAETGVPYRHLLTCGTVLGALILGFSAYSLLSLNVVWLPAYLAESLGYSPAAAGWIVTLPSLCLIVILPAICAVSERLEQLGASSRFARGWLSSLCVMTAGLATIALPLSSGHALPIACVAIAFSIGNVIFALGHIMVAEVTPVRQRGAMLGIYNAVVTLAGPLAPVAMGLLVDVGASPADGFRTGFIVAGSVVTVGGFAGLLLMNPEADRAALFRQGRADAGVLWQ